MQMSLWGGEVGGDEIDRSLPAEEELQSLLGPLIDPEECSGQDGQLMKHGEDQLYVFMSKKMRTSKGARLDLMLKINEKGVSGGVLQGSVRVEKVSRISWKASATIKLLPRTPSRAPGRLRGMIREMTQPSIPIHKIRRSGGTVTYRGKSFKTFATDPTEDQVAALTQLHTQLVEAGELRGNLRGLREHYHPETGVWHFWIDVLVG